MNFDGMPSAVIVQLIQQAEEIQRAKRQEVCEALLQKWRAEAEELGLTLEDIVGGRQPTFGQKRTWKLRGSGQRSGKTAAKDRGRDDSE